MFNYQSKNLESTNNLVKAFQTAKANVSGLTSADHRRVFSNNIDVSISFLNNVPVIDQYDMTEIDTLLTEMIHLYTEALKNGDLETAKHSAESIYIALTEFRKELNMDEVPQEEVLNKRVQKLSKYKIVLVLSKNIFINRKSVEDKEKEYNQHIAEYEKIYKELEEEITERPDLYKYIQNFRPGIDELSPEAYEMISKIEKLNKIVDYIYFLNNTITDYNQNINDLKQALEYLLTSF